MATNPDSSGNVEDYVFPGRKTNTKSDTAPKRTYTKRKQSTSALQTELSNTIADLGKFVSLFEAYDGMVIQQQSVSFAAGWCKVAEQNDTVRTVLEGALSSSAWGAALFGTFGLVYPILVHHGIAPKPFKAKQEQPTATVYPMAVPNMESVNPSAAQNDKEPDFGPLDDETEPADIGHVSL